MSGSFSSSTIKCSVGPIIQSDRSEGVTRYFSATRIKSAFVVESSRSRAAACSSAERPDRQAPTPRFDGDFGVSTPWKTFSRFLLVTRKYYQLLQKRAFQDSLIDIALAPRLLLHDPVNCRGVLAQSFQARGIAIGEKSSLNSKTVLLFATKSFLNRS